MGLDYNAYGNSIVSMSFPFKKHLTCKNCGYTERAEKIRQHWTFTNFDFRFNCPECGTTEPADVKTCTTRMRPVLS